MSTYHYSKKREITLTGDLEYDVRPGYKGDHLQPPEPIEITFTNFISAGQDILDVVPQAELDAAEEEIRRDYKPDDKEECP